MEQATVRAGDRRLRRWPPVGGAVQRRAERRGNGAFPLEAFPGDGKA